MNDMEDILIKRAQDFSEKVTDGHNFRDLITGYIEGFKNAMLTVEDIDRIGELFNECQTKLEKEHSEYSDWGVPSMVLAEEVLKKFYEERFGISVL